MSLTRRRSRVVFPEPVWPTRKTNSPLSTRRFMSERPATPVPKTFETVSSRIIYFSTSTFPTSISQPAYSAVWVAPHTFTVRPTNWDKSTVDEVIYTFWLSPPGRTKWYCPSPLIPPFCTTPSAVSLKVDVSLVPYVAPTTTPELDVVDAEPPGSLLVLY